MSKPRKGTVSAKGKEIEKLREQTCQSHTKLAERAGITPRTLSRIISGVPAYFDTIARIANALGVEPKRLIVDNALTTTEIPVEEEENIKNRDVKQDILSVEVHKKADNSISLRITVDLSAATASTEKSQRLMAFYNMLRQLLPDNQGLIIVALTSTTASIAAAMTPRNVCALQTVNAAILPTEISLPNSNNTGRRSRLLQPNPGNSPDSGSKSNGFISADDLAKMDLSSIRDI